jgi:hypothetical protein
MARLISIDPGVNYFAWALFDDSKFVACGTVKRESAQAMIFSWIGICSAYKPHELVIEGQQVFPSAKSWSSAVEGHLIDLAHCTGMLVGSFEEGLQWAIIPPTRWKGQLTKKVVQARIKEVTGCNFDGHEADAVGLGLWHLGKLQPLPPGKGTPKRRGRGRGRARESDVRGGGSGTS